MFAGRDLAEGVVVVEPVGGVGVGYPSALVGGLNGVAQSVRVT